MYVVPFIYRIYIVVCIVSIGAFRLSTVDSEIGCASVAPMLENAAQLDGLTYLLGHVHAVEGVAEVAAGQLGGGAMMQTLLLAAHAAAEGKEG